MSRAIMTNAELQELYGKLMQTEATFVEVSRKMFTRVLTELVMRRSGSWDDDKYLPGHALPTRIELSNQEQETT
jgi:hypothetical protein